MPEVPAAALAAAVAAKRKALCDMIDGGVTDEDVVRRIVEAALPALREQLAGELAAAARPDLTAVPWRLGGSHKRSLYAEAGFSAGKPGTYAGHMDTDQLAARACADHNEALDLRWLIAAGHDVQLGGHDDSGGPAFYVRLLGDEGGSLESFSGRRSLGQALADARGWSERQGITP